MSVFNDLRSYSRRWVKAFIETYKTEASLWQMSHADYTNNTIRNLAYDKLVVKLKEVEQNADRNMVVKKINSLRSAFRREYRKKMTDDGYEPRLWYYDIMLFIATQKTTSRKSTNGRKKSTTLNSTKKLTNSKRYIKTYKINQDTLSIQQDESENEDNDESIGVFEEEAEEEPDDQSASIKQENSNPMPVQVLQVANIEPDIEPQATNEKCNEINTNMEQAYSSHEHNQHQTHHQEHQQDQLHQPQPQQGPVIQSIQLSKEQLHAFLNGGSTITSTPLNSSLQQLLEDTSTLSKQNSSSNNRQRHEDEFDAIGYNVASKLRVMNHTQRIIAEKLISDILFNGQLDTLTVSSKIS